MSGKKSVNTKALVFSLPVNVKKAGLPKQPLKYYLNMEYRRKSPGEALFLPGKGSKFMLLC